MNEDLMELLVGRILSNNHRFSDKSGSQWYAVMIRPIIYNIITVSRENKERNILTHSNKGMNWVNNNTKCVEVI